MCSTGIGHEKCLTQFTTIDYVGHKADKESWTRSKNRVYKRKIARQQKKIK